MVRKFDFLVIGSGIAGMSFALKVAEKGTVALICKAGMEEANTGRHRLGDQSGRGQLRQAHRRHHDSRRLDQRPRRRGEGGA